MDLQIRKGNLLGSKSLRFKVNFDMSTEYIKTESKEEWLALRAKDVTSTESAALFGLSPYHTEFDLFHRKRDGRVVEIPENERMRAGTYLEPAIAEWASDEIGCHVQRLNAYCRDGEARIGASFDYQITNGKLAGRILEIKNVAFDQRYKWENEEGELEPPPHIEVQVQHQLELTQRPGAHIAVLFGGNDLNLIPVSRIPRIGLGLRNRIKRFWSDVDSGREPEPDFERDADFITSIHQMSGDEILKVDEDSEIWSLMKGYQAARDNAKAHTASAESIKAKVLHLIGDGVCKVLGGNLTLSCGMVKDTEPTRITQDMIGKTYGGKRGHRNFRVTEMKPNAK